MQIGKTRDGNVLTIKLEGRLDTITAPELESALEGSLTDLTTLVFDMEKLEYISSAGLRVLLSSHKKMLASLGQMIVKNVSEEIMEIFEVTGFSDILTIE